MARRRRSYCASTGERSDDDWYGAFAMRWFGEARLLRLPWVPDLVAARSQRFRWRSPFSTCAFWYSSLISLISFHSSRVLEFAVEQ